jgi:hypothetical protein
MALMVLISQLSNFGCKIYQIWLGFFPKWQGKGQIHIQLSLMFSDIIKV